MQFPLKKNYSPKTPSQEAVRYASLKNSHRPTKRKKWSPEHKGPKPKSREVARSYSHSSGWGCPSGRWLPDWRASQGHPGWSRAALWWAEQAAGIGPRGYPAGQRAQGRAQGLCGQNGPILENNWWFNWACWPTCKRSRKWEDEGHWCSELAEIYSKIERRPIATTPGTNSRKECSLKGIALNMKLCGKEKQNKMNLLTN